jgi:hypothetical protein
MSAEHTHLPLSQPTTQELVMNQNSLSEYEMFINHQILWQEKLLEYHQKAHSILEVLLASNLTRYSALTLHSCLWQISDTLAQAKAINESLLDTLLKILKLLESSKGSPDGHNGNSGTVH